MTHPVISKLYSTIDRVVEDPGSVFILLFILALTYLLVSATFYQGQTIDASWGFLSDAFYLLVIGVALRFLRPKEARFVVKHAYPFLFLGFFFVLVGSLYVVALNPLQAPPEIANVLAFYLLVAGVVAWCLSYRGEDKSKRYKIQIKHFASVRMGDLYKKIYKPFNPFKRLERLLFKTVPLLPLTYWSILRHRLEKGDSNMLDVGCGKGRILAIINQRKKRYAVGIDLFLPYLKMAKAKRTHDDHLRCDAQFLPFRKNSFDTVICLEVIEHLEKKRALACLKAIEDIARFQVVLTTPVGFYPQGEYDGNPLQTHKSHWAPSELTNLGYKVRGNGLRPLYIDERMIIREHGLRGSGFLAKPLVYVAFLVSYMLRPLIYFCPSLGDHMICVKNKLD